ncbi:phosphoribosylaminoimidazolesuccinocarboxamide synthase, partial [Streptomyces sp. NPDC048279]|uniref:phosphoribosylaminoimidazolesuccinocarboxamide synthase n=1 Tax=Streptomyces sp. NPDC048279 TaxID=3154714 RepID=UPI00343B29E2
TLVLADEVLTPDSSRFWPADEWEPGRARRRTGGMALLERTVSGQPGLVALQDGVVVSVFAFDVAGDRIRNIWVMRNPDKLSHWTTG